MNETLELFVALPEIFLVLAALLLLMVGVFQKGNGAGNGYGLVSTLAIIALVVSGGLLCQDWPTTKQVVFSGMFILDGFSAFGKLMLLVASAFAIAMSNSWMRQEGLGRFEYPVLILLATVGMMMMVSANDFLALYMGLELQSLSLYVLAAYHRDSGRASEAGLKYYVLGSLASGLLLYGISLIYGFAGSTSFTTLAQVFSGHTAPHMGFIVGLVFVIAGLAFKISAVPFHMWAPDVYEGAPTPVTAFFSVAPKIAAMLLLTRVLMGPFGELVAQWQQVIVLISILSMFVGAFAALVQTNIKRLMAYSSIGHAGFILVGLAAGTAEGMQGVLIYMAIYLAMNMGTFAVILCMRQQGRMVESIHDLAGLSKTHPMMALTMVVMMFSMAGIPPMAGFWGKFYVFKAAVDAGLMTLAILGVLTSVVSAFYYLRIIKIMYFDEAVESFDRSWGMALVSVMVLATVLILFFTLLPGPLLTSAQAAVALF